MFKVLNENRNVARGYISDLNDNWNSYNISMETDEKLELNSDDIYSILRERDYNYK